MLTGAILMAALLPSPPDAPPAPRGVVARALAALGLGRAPLPPTNGHARVPPASPPAPPADGERAFGGNLDPFFVLNERLRVGQTALTNPYRQHAWFYAIVSQRAKQVTQARLALYRRGVDDPDEVPATDPLAQLFAHPNDALSLTDAIEVTSKHLDAVGESFWVLDRDPTPTLVPRRIWPVAGGSAWMPREVGPDGVIQEWTYRRQGRTAHYHRTQVVMFRHPDPDNPIRGLAPAKVALTGIETDVLLRDWNAEFIRQGAQPAGWIEVPWRLTREQRERLDAGHQERHGGQGKRGRFGIFEAGAKWHDSQISHRDMEFLDLRRWSREELAAVMDWPLWMLTGDASAYAEATAQRARLWFETVIPLLRRFETTLDQQLFEPLQRDVIGLFDIDRVPALVDYRRTLWATATQMVANGVSLQEVNRLLDLGVQEQPGWDEVWRPMGMVPTSETLAMLEAPAAPSTTPAAEATPEPGGVAEQTTPPTAMPAPGRGRRTIAAPTLRRYWRAWRQRVMQPSERTGTRTLGRYLADVSNAIDAAARKHLRSREWAEVFTAWAPAEHAEHARWARALDLPTAVLTRPTWPDAERQITAEALLDELFPRDTWDGRLRAQFRPYAQQVATLGGAFVEAVTTTFGKVFDPTSPAVAQYLESRVQKVVGINATTRDALARTLGQGFAAGESIDELRARIANVSSALADPARALRIARTEAGSLADGARFHMGTVGEDTQIWLSAGDGIVRPSHAEAEDESRSTPVVVGQPFSNGLLFPHDPGGEAGETQNCRCSAWLLPQGIEVEL